MKRLTISLFIITTLAITGFFGAATPVVAKDYFVSPNGNDSNPGTTKKPFKTLVGACHKVPAGKNTIRLAAGIYSETEACLVPAGVSLVGAGATGAKATIIRSSMTADMELDATANHPDKFLIQTYDSTNASFHDFAIEGNLPDSQRAHGGILVHNVKGFSLYNLTARSFNYAALYVSDADHAKIVRCYIEDSAHPHKDSCSGAILLGALTDSVVRDCVIRENRGAYGIKVWDWGWGQRPNPKPVWPDQVSLKRVWIENNDIHVCQIGGWGNGQPNMYLEFWNARPEECVITGNRFNEIIYPMCDFF